MLSERISSKEDWSGLEFFAVCFLRFSFVKVPIFGLFFDELQIGFARSNSTVKPLGEFVLKQ